MLDPGGAWSCRVLLNERRVGCRVPARAFKPARVPGRKLEEVVISLDEAESIRLADLEGLYQEAAAMRMAVSRQTFGRIVEAARRKVADALINESSSASKAGKSSYTKKEKSR